MKTYVSNLKALTSYLQDLEGRGMIEPEQAKALVLAIKRCAHSLAVDDRRRAQQRLADLTRRVWEVLSGNAMSDLTPNELFTVLSCPPERAVQKSAI